MHGFFSGARRATTFLAIGVAALATSAGAAPSAVDLYVSIAVGPTLRESRPLADGATTTVTGLTFWAGPGVELITAEPASATVRFQLPEGLRWGGFDLPDPSEGCTSTPATAECQTRTLEPITGRTGDGWGWDIVAAQVGTYVLRAEILSASTTDPEPANNTASVTVVVTEPAGGGGSGGGAGGGGAASVSTSAVKLSPAKPKAGSTVVASIRVTKGGAPLRPANITCAGTLGAAKAKGSAKASNGLASCLYKTPRSAKGKILRGKVSFTAGGTKFTKRFSTKLG